jgi:hypothetical protein
MRGFERLSETLNQSLPADNEGLRTLPPDGEPLLLCDLLVALDSSGGAQANTFTLPPEPYWDWGGGDQVLLTIEIHRAGSAIVSLFFQRTQSDGSDDETFEDMNPVGIAVASGHTITQYVFGRNPTVAGDKTPQGLGRLRLTNTTPRRTCGCGCGWRCRSTARSRGWGGERRGRCGRRLLASARIAAVRWARRASRGGRDADRNLLAR